MKTVSLKGKTTKDTYDVKRFREKYSDVFASPGIERTLLFLQTEVGELCDSILRFTGKEIRGSEKRSNIENIEEEFSDVYFMLISAALHFDINISVEKTIQKLTERCENARAKKIDSSR